MKILVADKIAASGVEFLKNQKDLEVIEAYGSSPEAILELVKDVSGIIVRSDTQITREVIDAAPLLKAVGRAGVGVDNIDIEAATVAPRIHLEGNVLRAEPGVDEGELEELEGRYEVDRWQEQNLFFGGANSVTPVGGAGDPRRSGAAIII